MKTAIGIINNHSKNQVIKLVNINNPVINDFKFLKQIPLMMISKKCVIVIPLHKPDPSFYELVSLEQCYKVLGTHPIFIVAPRGMDLSEYQKIIQNLSVKYIDPAWLSSLLNYNKLKLSNYFYNLFADYTYLLTYELDAFVFNDNVNYWCDKGYDYIGASWFKSWDVPDAAPGDQLVAMGNSGFSIRNIAAMRKGIKSVYYHDPLQIDDQPVNKYVHGAKKLLHTVINKFSSENTTFQNAKLLNEDWVIPQLIAKKNKNFKLAPVNFAVKFSFEIRPETLFKMNHSTLPMGCHAWWRYNFNFWKPLLNNLAKT